MRLMIKSVAVSALFTIIYLIYRKFIYSFGFTDEGDNITIGQYILMGKSVYRDIFSQHQPLTYFLSAGIQYLAHPDNILLVVRRHRQFVMLFSFAWIAFLTFRLSLWVLPFLAIIELLKYYFLGHLFLAESLVIYPLIYIGMVWWRSLSGNKLSMVEAILVSLSSFWLVFNLLPTMTTVGVVVATLLYQNRTKKKILAALTIPAVVATTLLFIFVPIDAYVEGTIWANFLYYIPRSTKVAFNIEESKYAVLVKAFTYPFITFFVPKNALIIVYRLLTVAWIAALIRFATSKKRIVTAAFLVLLVALSNLRPAFGTHIFYHAFHSLPFFALFVVSISMLLQQKGRVLWRWMSVGMVIVAIMVIFLNKNIFFRESIQEQDISYINFAEVFTYSTVIKALAQPTDTLMVVPHEEFLYWYPRLLPPTRFLFYEAWVHDVPKFRQEMYDGLQKHPPSFVYWPEVELEPFLKTEKYISIARNTATYSALHVRRDIVPQITDTQWNALEVHGFKRIQ